MEEGVGEFLELFIGFFLNCDCDLCCSRFFLLVN